MTRSKAAQLSPASWTTSLAVLSLISGVTVWHLLRTLPFETLSSPSDLLALILGVGLAISVAALGIPADGRSRPAYWLLASCLLTVAIAEYLLDSHAYDWIDPYVALSWIALGACLASPRVVGPLSNSARLCIGIGLAVELLELFRSVAVVSAYGDAPQPALFQWFESESDLLLRTAFMIGVIELWCARAIARPAPLMPSSGKLARTVLAYLRTSPLLSPLLNLRRQYSYDKFKAHNPDASFGEFYASRVNRILDTGHGHPTLGRRTGGLKLPFARRPLRAEEFRQYGLGHFDFAQRAGLKSHHICVDYGCGSLRVGQHLIQYLDSGNYWGLDIVDRFFRDGLDLLSKEARDKSPNLRVISEETLREAATWHPDFVVCFAVLTHVPREELEIILDRIMRLAGDKGTIVLSFYEAEAYFQRGVASFTHNAQSIERPVLTRRPDAALRYHRKRRRNRRTVEWHTHLEIRPAFDIE